MDKGKNSILEAMSCEECVGKLLWLGHTFHFPAIGPQIEYMHSNMMTRYGVVQALKTATVPVYPGGSSRCSGQQTHPLMHRLHFFSHKKGNKCILWTTRWKRSHPNWKGNSVLKSSHMDLDQAEECIWGPKCLCQQYPPLWSRKRWSWRAGFTKQGYKLTEDLSWHLFFTDLQM